jgi:4-hydroxybenzoate polyprenyltransferase
VIRERARAYLELCRVSNLPTVWTNVLAGTLLAAGSWCGLCFFGVAIAASCFYAAGMCLNDLCDHEIDRTRKPLRPIPSGRVPLSGARAATVALFSIALLSIFSLVRSEARLPGLLLFGAIVLYDFVHREQPWSVYVMAACRFLLFPLAALGVRGELGFPVLLGGVLQFGYVLVLSAVARQENVRGVPYAVPLVPWMLAGIALLDGLMLALLVAPAWFAAGVAGAGMTLAGQRWIRGD